jgi:hypothetical protein
MSALTELLHGSHVLTFVFAAVITACGVGGIVVLLDTIAYVIQARRSHVVPLRVHGKVGTHDRL